ncbi:MAG: hypothetical protein AAGC57_11815, partial [Pseudomonadota bacterium]
REISNQPWPIERHRHRSPARFRRNQQDTQPMPPHPQTCPPKTPGGTAQIFIAALLLSGAIAVNAHPSEAPVLGCVERKISYVLAPPRLTSGGRAPNRVEVR